jgi:hypothetical protein
MCCLCGDSSEEGSPIRIFYLIKTGEPGRQGDRKVTPLNGSRRLVCHRIKSTVVLAPFQKKPGFTDAPPPPDNSQATSVDQSLQSPQFLLPVKEFHRVDLLHSVKLYGSKTEDPYLGYTDVSAS